MTLQKYAAPRPPTWLEILFPSFLTAVLAWILVSFTEVMWWGVPFGAGVYLAAHVLDLIVPLSKLRNWIGTVGTLIVLVSLIAGSLFFGAVADPALLGIAGGVILGFAITGVTHVVGVAAWFGGVKKRQPGDRSIFYTSHSIRTSNVEIE